MGAPAHHRPAVQAGAMTSGDHRPPPSCTGCCPGRRPPIRIFGGRWRSSGCRSGRVPPPHGCAGGSRCWGSSAMEEPSPRFHQFLLRALTPDPRRATLLSVDSDELRAVQQPLKDRYRADPDAALVTLTAEGTLGEGITCSVATGRALAEARLHPATGGDGLAVCSGDMLLPALAAWAGVTLAAVATSLAIPVRGGRVLVEG